MIKASLTSLALSTLLFSQTLVAAEAVDQAQKVAATAEVNVNVQRGNIIFRSWDKNEVAVKGQLDEVSQGLTFTVSGSNVLIEDKMPKKYNGNNQDGSQLTIMLPQKIKLQAKGLSTNYRLNIFDGKMDISSISGNIKAEQLTNKVTLHTVSGDINSRALNGKILLETVSGKIKDTDSQGKMSYRSVSGDIHADSSLNKMSLETVSGYANIKLDTINKFNVKTVSGNIDLSVNNLKDKANIESVSGDLNLHFVDNGDTSFNISGGPSGNIINKLTQDKVSKELYSPHTYIKFKTGDGSAHLNASTVSGNIVLSR
ncbi:DUF4097 family beta strand repeat-containing protein [Shewanella sp.]|nr:DUF4097 family beta strand repeat-containing protein [Shewanella sp.]